MVVATFDAAIRQRIAQAAGRNATPLSRGSAAGMVAPSGSRMRPTSGQGYDAELDAFMAAIRQQESSGNYNILGPQTRYGRPRGAYQILDSNWDTWAAQAGIAGASWKDPEAQDRVARYKFLEYYKQFGSWEAVAVAWFAGPGRAAKYVEDPSSVAGLSDVLGTSVARYVQKAMTGTNERLGRRAVNPPTGVTLGPSQSWDEQSVGDAAQKLAEAFGLQVTSHTRSQSQNAAIGGAPNSDHLSGLGIDLAGDNDKMMALANYLEQFTGANGPLRIVLNPNDHPHGTGPHVHVSFKANSNAPLALPGGDPFAPGGAVQVGEYAGVMPPGIDAEKRGAAGLVAALRGGLGDAMNGYDPQGVRNAGQPVTDEVQQATDELGAARRAGLR